MLCRLPKIWRAVPIFLARVNGVLVWLFDKGEVDDKTAMIAMRRRIFRKNVPTSNAQQSCIASLNLCSKVVAHIPRGSLKNVLYSRNCEVRRRLATSNQLCS